MGVRRRIERCRSTSIVPNLVSVRSAAVVFLICRRCRIQRTLSVRLAVCPVSGWSRSRWRRRFEALNLKLPRIQKNVDAQLRRPKPNSRTAERRARTITIAHSMDVTAVRAPIRRGSFCALLEFAEFHRHFLTGSREMPP